MNSRNLTAHSSKASPSIHTLSDALAQRTKCTLFPEDMPDTLDSIIEKMRAQGYQVSAPERASQAPRVPGRTPWVVTITIPRNEHRHAVACDLLFYIPDDIS